MFIDDLMKQDIKDFAKESFGPISPVSPVSPVSGYVNFKNLPGTKWYISRNDNPHKLQAGFKFTNIETNETMEFYFKLSEIFIKSGRLEKKLFNLLR